MKRRAGNALDVQLRRPEASQVSFAQLCRFLGNLGFQKAERETGHRLEHLPSQTVFLFRAYKDADPVYLHDLALVRSQLDWRGLMPAEVFDRSLQKTPA